LRHYTSFTSPIRKYVDLSVHRQILDMLDRFRSACGENADSDASSKRRLVSCDSVDEYYASCTRLLNVHEANYAAFKKAVVGMFSISCGHTVAFTVSVDSDRSKFSVSAEVDSLHVYRDLLMLSKAEVPDDRITAFGQPAKEKEMKIRRVCCYPRFDSSRLHPL
jgi:hypothetical protein